MTLELLSAVDPQGASVAPGRLTCLLANVPRTHRANFWEIETLRKIRPNIPVVLSDFKVKLQTYQILVLGRMFLFHLFLELLVDINLTNEV